MVSVRFLSSSDIDSIHSSSLEFLESYGVKVDNQAGRELLSENGCEIDANTVKIPTHLIKECLESAPTSFDLYSPIDEDVLTVGADNIVYNPGSSVGYFLDRVTGEIREGETSDLAKLVRVVEHLQYIQAQSTAVVPADVPGVVADFTRLYIVLKNSGKPLITGALRKEGVRDMACLLDTVAGKDTDSPRAVFDCCPVSPLVWSDSACQNLMDCAELGIPAEIVPAPLMGATSPVTIVGTLIQANVEILSGITIAQLAKPGTPVVYGGAISNLDMRYATPHYGSVMSMIASCASSEVGKHYRLPTHAYIGLSDSKAVDAQAGYETGLGVTLAALSKINVVSGPGVLSHINCQSLEKLVFDNEMCGAAYRLADGVNTEGIGIIVDLLREIGPGGDFLRQKHTSSHFRREHFIPSKVIDRLNQETWTDEGAKDALTRTGEVVDELLDRQPPFEGDEDVRTKLDEAFRGLLKKYDVSVTSIMETV